jgi:hypothetical protein
MPNKEIGPDPARPKLIQAISDRKPIGALLKRATDGQPEVKCSAVDRNPPGAIDNILVSASFSAPNK